MLLKAAVLLYSAAVAFVLVAFCVFVGNKLLLAQPQVKMLNLKIEAASLL